MPKVYHLEFWWGFDANFCKSWPKAKIKHVSTLSWFPQNYSQKQEDCFKLKCKHSGGFYGVIRNMYIALFSNALPSTRIQTCEVHCRWSVKRMHGLSAKFNYTHHCIQSEILWIFAEHNHYEPISVSSRWSTLAIPMNFPPWLVQNQIFGTSSKKTQS